MVRMVQMVLEPSWPQIQWSLFQKLPGIGMSNIDFLIANMMLLLPHAKIIFSQRGATDLKKSIWLPHYHDENYMDRQNSTGDFPDISELLPWP